MRILLPLAAFAITATSAFLLAHKWRATWAQLQAKIAELQAALDTSLQHRAAERKGRIRAQRDLRKALQQKDASDSEAAVYPMTPIGTIHSCFSTRNGTPRQPLLVPIARACLTLMPGGVPQTAFDGLVDFSHCWLLYVFHANTDLPHLWKQPHHRDFKAKVRVPRLDGGKLGVYATRSPHRPCPIGLTVARVEGVHGRMLLLSGIDLVDGTPILDIKPYLPFCDSVRDAYTPSWVAGDSADDPLALVSVEFSKDFENDIYKCWEIKGRESMYSSPEEFQTLVQQVLTRDIRSLRQRHNPYKSNSSFQDEDTSFAGQGHPHSLECDVAGSEDVFVVAQGGHPCNEDREYHLGKSIAGFRQGKTGLSNTNPDIVVYHVILEGIDIAYTVENGQLLVQGASVSSTKTIVACECNYGIWARVGS